MTRRERSNSLYTVLIIDVIHSHLEDAAELGAVGGRLEEHAEFLALQVPVLALVDRLEQLVDQDRLRRTQFVEDRAAAERAR